MTPLTLNVKMKNLNKQKVIVGPSVPSCHHAQRQPSAAQSVLDKAKLEGQKHDSDEKLQPTQREESNSLTTRGYHRLLNPNASTFLLT